MTVVTTKADDRIMEAFAAINGEYKTIDLDNARDIIDLFQLLLDINDDVIYCHPVCVIHDRGYLERLLEQYDFIAVQQQGQAYMDFSLIAATHEGLERIVEQYKTGLMAIDMSQGAEHNMHNLVLNALGTRARVIIDDGTVVKPLRADMRGRGIIATHCGTPEIIDYTRRSKLNVADVVVLNMNNKGGNNEQH